jgi:hypothetical protein
MARITGAYGSKTYAINRFLGVNENPDGDTNLKAGEAAEMRNFKITSENSLQIRPGTKTVVSLADAPVRALWNGYVGGTEYIAAACGNKVWQIDPDAGTATEIGVFGTAGTVTFFGYEEKAVYAGSGSEYKVWDARIDRCRRIPSLSSWFRRPPTGGGTELSGQYAQRPSPIWFSPDGASTVFQDPKRDLRV